MNQNILEPKSTYEPKVLKRFKKYYIPKYIARKKYITRPYVADIRQIKSFFENSPEVNVNEADIYHKNLQEKVGSKKLKTKNNLLNFVTRYILFAPTVLYMIQNKRNHMIQKLFLSI